MKEISTVLTGLIVGVLSYLIVSLSLKPIIRYRKTKHDILSDLIFFANVINPERLNENMKKKM